MTERRMPTEPQLLACEELEANLKNDATDGEQKKWRRRRG